MNDVIFHLRFIEYVKNDQVRRIEIEAKLAAMGAAYHNGFAIQLPDVPMSKVKEDSIEWSIDGIAQSTSPLESGQTNAVLILTEDLWDHTSIANGCNFLRTETGCGTAHRTTWRMIIPFETTITQSQMPDFPYDPFIFATPGMDHGLAAKNVVGGHPGRQLEIHLKNRAPTDKFATAYFGSREDRSSPNAGQYFLNENGMAWAIEVPVTWQHPKERERLDSAYSDFVDFAADSSGATKPSWYTNPNNSLIFNEQ